MNSFIYDFCSPLTQDARIKLPYNKKLEWYQKTWNLILQFDTVFQDFTGLGNLSKGRKYIIMDGSHIEYLNLSLFLKEILDTDAPSDLNYYIESISDIRSLYRKYKENESIYTSYPYDNKRLRAILKYSVMHNYSLNSATKDFRDRLWEDLREARAIYRVNAATQSRDFDSWITKY